jgi:hypothetical protein
LWIMETTNWSVSPHEVFRESHTVAKNTWPVSNTNLQSQVTNVYRE